MTQPSQIREKTMLDLQMERSRRVAHARLIPIALLLFVCMLLIPAPSPAAREAGRSATATADPTIALAGDISCDPLNSNYNGGLGSSSACRQKYTSDLLVNGGYSAVLLLGDNQYECGSLAAYQQSFDPAWGRVKPLIRPTPGNHEYITSSAGTTGCTSANAGAAGYFGYFGAAGAGVSGKGYYSYDVGSWHLIAINSQCGPGGGCSAGTAQEAWLKNDLATHKNFCTLAYWHVPLFSSGGRAASNTQVFWQDLYDADADVVVAGHDHIYERFAPQNPNGGLDNARGIRQFIAGTGGNNHTSIATVAANSEVRDTTTFGVLKLTLHAASYDWAFVPDTGSGTFTDSGTGNCHGTNADTQPPTAPTNLRAVAASPSAIDLSWAAATDNVGVTGYRIFRDSVLLTTVTGTTFTDGGLVPSTAHTYQVYAIDAAGNQSPASNTATATTLADTVPPTAPSGLTATVVGAGRIDLSFTGSTDNVRVDHYNIIRGGTQIGATTGTTYSDTTVAPSTTYTYTVRAVDAAGNVSGASNTATATTPAPPTVFTFVPTEDASARSDLATTNLGTSTTLNVDGSPLMRTYLKFTVAGVAGRTVLSAKLRLYCTDDASVFGGEVHRVPDTTWSETAITWNTAPPPDAAIISSFGSVATATWYEVDVTSAISGDGVVSLAVTSTNADGAHYASRETGANAPQLVVTTSAAAPDTTPPSQPGSLLVSGRTATSLTLGWTASTDNVGVDHYEVARDGTVLGNTVSTGYTDTGLAPSSLHHYAVVAVDAAGNRSSAALVDGTTAPDTTPPTAPTGLTLVGATATQVSLSWTAATDDVGVTGYRVFRNALLLGTSVTTSYTDATVTGSTSYSYTVKAMDAAGNASPDSAALAVTTPAAPDTTPPTAPTGLTAPSVTPTQVQLTWNAATDNVGVTGYRIYRGGVRIGTSTTTGYTDATVAAATTYSYTVTAVDAAANESVPSAALSVTTPAAPDTTPPTQPGGLVVSATTATSVSLRWTASTDNVGVHHYEVSRDSGAPASTTATAYTDSGLTPNTLYRYSVVAVDAAGNRSTAALVNGTTAPDTTPPTAPTGLAAAGVTATQVPLRWVAATDDVGVTGYRVYRNGLLLGTSATTSYTDLTVSAATSYTYTVSALDAAGNESPQSSPPLTVTTPAAGGQVLFSDGFETGNMSKWTLVNGVAAQQALVFSGLWGARMTSTTGATYAYGTLAAPATDVTYSLQFNIASQGANNINLLRLRNPSNGSLGAVYVTGSDLLSLRNDSASVSTTSTVVVSQGAWHTLRVHFVVGGVTASLEEVWLDGVKVDALTRTDTLGTTPIGTVQLGESSTARTYDVAYDDVRVTSP